MPSDRIANALAKAKELRTPTNSGSPYVPGKIAHDAANGVLLEALLLEISELRDELKART